MSGKLLLVTLLVSIAPAILCRNEMECEEAVGAAYKDRIEAPVSEECPVVVRGRLICTPAHIALAAIAGDPESHLALAWTDGT